MNFEITVNIPGLKELAEAIGQIASVQKKEQIVQETVPVQQPQPKQEPQQETYGRQVASHFPEANVSVPQQETVQPQSVTQEIPQAPQPAVQTSVPTYTRDELSKAAMLLMDKGMQAQLMQLIQSFGVQSLVELPPEQYGNFATGLRGMGAQI